MPETAVFDDESWLYCQAYVGWCPTHAMADDHRVSAAHWSFYSRPAAHRHCSCARVSPLSCNVVVCSHAGWPRGHRQPSNAHDAVSDTPGHTRIHPHTPAYTEAIPN